MANRDILSRIVIRAKDETAGVFGAIRKNIGGIATLIAGYFGARTFGDAIGSATEFEAAISRVAAASGASAAELEQLRAAADAAGTNTKFTATEAAGALENLAKAGLSASDAVKALPAVLDLAAAGGVELGESSEFISRAVSGMGLAFDEAGRVADVLAKGANASNTSVQGLAGALSFAAPVAQSLGLSLEQTVAIIGKFADAGIDASRAGTALNSILSQFSDPASRFRRELGEAGITTDDFGKALRQLAEAGPAGKDAVLAVGQEAGPALRALLNQGIGALDDLTSKLNNAQGSAKATAAVMTDNLDGAVTGLGSAWDALRRALVDPLLEPLKDQVVALSARLRDLVTSGAAGQIGEAFRKGFEAAAGYLQAFIDKLDVDAIVGRVTAFADRTGAAFEAIGAKAKAAGDSFDLLAGALRAGFNTLAGVLFKVAEVATEVVGGIVGAAADINDAFAKITFGDVSARFASAAREIRTMAGGIGAAADAFGKQSRDAFLDVADGAQQARDGWNGLAGSVKQAAGAVAAVIPTMRNLSETVGLTADQLDALGEGAEVVAGQVVKVAEASRQAAPAVAGLGQTASDAALALDNAFQTLGVTSTRALEETAAKAKAAFDLIRNSGKATAADIQAAFLAYAEKAIAANGGVVSEALKVQAAIHGIRLEASGLGDHVAVEFDRVGASARRAAHEIDGVSEAQRRLASAQQELSKPGAGGSVQNLPDGLTDEQLRDLNLTATQREDYLLNRNLSPEDRAAGIVKRSVATSSTSHRSLAIRKGLTDPDQIAAFEEVIGDLLAVKRHKAFVKLQSGTPVDAKTFQQMMLGAQRAAVREALQIAREVGGNVPGTGRAEGAPHPLAAVHRVQIVSGARVTNVDTASSSDAERLVGELQRLGARS